MKFRQWGLLFWHGKSRTNYCCRLWKTERLYSNVSVTFWINCWIFVSVILINCYGFRRQYWDPFVLGVGGVWFFLFPDKHHLDWSFLHFIPFVISLNEYSGGRKTSWFQDIQTLFSASGCKECLVISFVLIWDSSMEENKDSMNYCKFYAFIHYLSQAEWFFFFFLYTSMSASQFYVIQNSSTLLLYGWALTMCLFFFCFFTNNLSSSYSFHRNNTKVTIWSLFVILSPFTPSAP